MRANIIKKRLMSFAFEKVPRISLSCMLVPVQYREYEYGLLNKLGFGSEINNIYSQLYYVFSYNINL